LSTAARNEFGVRRFAAEIERAVRLREVLFQRDFDRQFIDDGGRLCYAFDSNVMHSYFRTVDGQRRFIPTFQGPPDALSSDSETRVFEIIVTHLVQSLSEHDRCISPAIILPGHIEEFRRLQDSLTAALDPQQRERQNAKNFLLSLLAKIDAAASTEQQKEIFIDNEAALHKLLYAVDDSVERLNRFNSLLAHGKLRGAKKVEMEPVWADLIEHDPRIHALLHGNLNISLNVDEGAADWWLRRLDFEESFARVDSTALGTLDRLNRCLEAQNVRVVLFTMNDEILEQGMRYAPFRHSDHRWRQFNFTDLYIRHPRTLLFDPKILAIGGGNGADMGWLNALLSEVSDSYEGESLVSHRAHFRDVRQRANFEDLAHHALKKAPDIHDRLHKNWVDHLENIATAHVSTTEIARENIRKRLAMREDRLPDLHDVSRQMADDIEKGWENFYLAAARSGYELIGLSEDKVRGQKRNVPALYLREMPEAEAVLDHIYEPDGAIRYEGLIRTKIEAIEQRNDRESQYITALLYSLLFAFADRWPVAKLLAMRAVGIGGGNEVNYRDAGQRVTGRESYFLAAVTHRLTAKGMVDLDIASSYLDEAVRRMPKEDDSDLRTSQPLTGIRFKAEQIAIDTARLLFEAWRAKWCISGASRIEAAARDNLSRVLSELTTDNVCQIERVRSASSMSLINNFIANIFLLECAEVLEDYDLVGLADLLAGQARELRDFPDDRLHRDPSAIDRQALLYAGSLLDSDSPSAELSSRVLEQKVSSSETFLMPFDESRYRHMANLAQARRNFVD
jgi:hypothetical protein